MAGIQKGQKTDNKETAYKVESCKQLLSNELNLHINPKNSIICRSSEGLHFLGHVITTSYIVVDKHTTKSVMSKLTPRNASSYKSLKLVQEAEETINRVPAEKLFAYYDDS